MVDLTGRVCVVTGASRGIGKGIAHELGIAGATVYVTGRTRRGAKADDGARGSIDETADLVTDAGGQGIAVRVDHTDDDQVRGLAERVREDQGGLDLLVNNAWAGYEHYDAAEWEQPFWEQPVERFGRMLDPGLRGHYATARVLVPLMLDRERALVVTVSAGDGDRYLGDVAYDVVKHAQQRLAYALSRHLAAHGIASLSVLPGFTRTERVLDAFDVDANAWRDEPGLEETHSPRFVGRAVVALAGDPNVADRSGQACKVGQLGLDLGFTDVDGSQPEPWCLPASADESK